MYYEGVVMEHLTDANGRECLMIDFGDKALELCHAEDSVKVGVGPCSAVGFGWGIRLRSTALWCDMPG